VLISSGVIGRTMKSGFMKSFNGVFVIDRGEFLVEKRIPEIIKDSGFS